MKKSLTYKQRLALKVWSAIPSHQVKGTWWNFIIGEGNGESLAEKGLLK